MNETDPNAPPASESVEAARERRLRALRALASQQLANQGQNMDAVGSQSGQTNVRAATPTAPAMPATPAAPDAPAPDAPSSTPSRPRRRGRALGVSAGVVALCIALVAVGAFNNALPFKLPFLGRTTAPLPPITTRSIVPLNDGVTCYADAAWAPKANLLALLGYQRDCPDLFNAGTFTTGMITIYSGATGKPQGQFTLDHLLTTQPGFPQAAEIIRYQNLLWSPNGKRLAITYVAEAYILDGTNFVTQVLTAGVLLVNTDGSHAQAITILNSQETDTAFNASPGVVIDVARGKLLAATTLAPTAVAYRWGANGQLTSLTGATASSGAVGSPSGGQQFTIWQPGAVQPGLSSTDPTVPGNIQTIPNLYLWNTNLAAWSPDGRYLYTPLIINRRIELPGAAAPAANIPNELETDSGVMVAPHDPALVGLYPSLTQSSETAVEYSEGFLPTTDVAWRPDGRVLATQPLIGPTQNVTTLTLYNCATGKVIMKLSHDAQGTEIFQDNTGTRVGDSLVRWSPDGARLALADPSFGTITFWTFNKPLI